MAEVKEAERELERMDARILELEERLKEAILEYVLTHYESRG